MTNFYAGIRAGRMVLSEEFAQALARDGCPPGPCIQVAPARARAMDSIALDDAPDEDATLNAAYEKMLREGNCPGGVESTGVTRLDFGEGAAERTRGKGKAFQAGFVSGDPAEEEKLYSEFRRARAWDRGEPEVMRIHFELERAYAEILGGN